MKRRNAIKTMGLLLSGSTIATAPISLFAASQQTALKIPELLSGNDQDSKKNYPLSIQTGVSQFLSDRETATLGFNGDYLGPTLRFRRGDQVALDVMNTLFEPTTVHWHGLHIPAAVDGGPHQIIEPGSTWNPEFSISQRAGTFWYHSHLSSKTGEQVYRGLAGMIIIDDETSESLELPQDYGVDDIPLIVQDRSFNEDGSFRYVGMHRDVMTGMYGDRLLTNGCINPLLVATRQKLRLRILNAANARSFSFAFSDGRGFQIVASDGGLLESPIKANEVMLAPAERAEIVVDIRTGSPVQLLGLPLPANSPFAAQGMMQRMIASGLNSTVVLTIEPQSSLDTSPALPTSLASFPRLQKADAVRQRNFKLSMTMGMGGGMMRGRAGAGNSGGMMGGGSGNFFINDKAMDMAVINERIPIGSLEVWQIENDSMMTHPFHVHHGQFQLISRNGQPPAGIELGEKDTIKVAPGETLQFLMRFDRFADPNHAYMYHCHILEHEDNGMMGQFTVE
jgi:blue copper oxidase